MNAPAPLLLDHLDLLKGIPPKLPILDLASGEGQNGLFLARKGFPVILCDISEDALQKAKKKALEGGIAVQTWRVDLEQDDLDPLSDRTFGAILVFRYLHRPLIPCIRHALAPGGLLVYETFTTEQPRFGRPYNPHFLLKPGELKKWFEDWSIHTYFEGVKDRPKRAVAQIVCSKPRKGTESDKGLSSCSYRSQRFQDGVFSHAKA
jgi:SAM-dependent methyltransferase